MTQIRLFFAGLFLGIFTAFGGESDFSEDVKAYSVNVFGDVSVDLGGEVLWGKEAMAVLFLCSENENFMTRLKQLTEAGDDDASALFGMIALKILPVSRRWEAYDVVLSAVKKKRTDMKSVPALTRAVFHLVAADGTGEQQTEFSGFADDLPVVWTSRIESKDEACKNILRKIRSAPVGKYDELNFYLDVMSFFALRNERDISLRMLFQPNLDISKRRIERLRAKSPFTAESYQDLIVPGGNYGQPVSAQAYVEAVKNLSDNYSLLGYTCRRNIALGEKDFLSAAYFGYLDGRAFWVDNKAPSDVCISVYSMQLAHLLSAGLAKEAIVLSEFLKTKFAEETQKNSEFLAMQNQLQIRSSCLSMREIDVLKEQGMKMGRDGFYENKEFEKRFRDSLRERAKDLKAKRAAASAGTATKNEN